MAPLLVRAQSSYKDVKKNMLILSYTHTHTHKHLISINMQSINQYIHIKQPTKLNDLVKATNMGP